MHAKEKTIKEKANKSSGKKKKRSWSEWLLILILVIGLGIFFYPIFSNWVNSYTATTVVANYSQQVDEMDDQQKNKLLEEARTFNDKLLSQRTLPGQLNDDQKEEYLQLYGGISQKVIGTLSIPSIKVNLPIYKGTAQEVLDTGIGHLEGSSVPAGGTGSHVVLSGHRGLPTMKLLSELDQLNEGDLFMIRTTGELLTYQVDSIHVVVPEDTHFLAIDPAKDLATLVTCTPYGVNTHRLLVTGHRVPNELDPSSSRPDAYLINRLTVGMWIAIPIVIILIAFWIFHSGKKRREEIDSEFDDDSFE